MLDKIATAVVLGLLVLFILGSLYAFAYALLNDLIYDSPLHPTASAPTTIAFNLFGLIALILVGALYALCDSEFATSHNDGWLFFFIFVGSGYALVMTFRRRARSRWAAVIAFVLFTLAVRPIEWGTYKPFLIRFDAVKPGMTLEQVQRIMSGYEAAPGTDDPKYSPFATKPGPCIESAGSTRAYTCVLYFAPRPEPGYDRAVITFQGGIVVKVY